MPAAKSQQFNDLMQQRQKLVAEFIQLRNKIKEELLKFKAYNEKAKIWNCDSSRMKRLDENLLRY